MPGDDAGDSRGNIYNYWDNQALVQLGKPWQATRGVRRRSRRHSQMADPVRFYRNTQSDAGHRPPAPFRADTFILISAGWDGEYGTADDICNFDWKYKE